VHFAVVDGRAQVVGIDLRSVESYSDPEPQPVQRAEHDTLGAAFTPPGEQPEYVEHPFSPITASVWQAFRFAEHIEPARTEMVETAQAFTRWPGEDSDVPAERRFAAEVAAIGQRQLDSLARPGMPRQKASGKPPALRLDRETLRRLRAVFEQAHRLGERNVLRYVQQHVANWPEMQGHTPTRDQANHWRREVQNSTRGPEFGPLPSSKGRQR
jgi:hypothetical protein